MYQAALAGGYDEGMGQNRDAPKVVIVSLVLLLICYVAAYVATVKAESVPFRSGMGPWGRIGGRKRCQEPNRQSLAHSSVCFAVSRKIANPAIFIARFSFHFAMDIWEGSTMSARRALFQKLRLAQVSRPRRTSRPQVSKGVRASVVRSLACLTQTLSRYKSLVILNIETLPKLPLLPSRKSPANPQPPMHQALTATAAATSLKKTEKGSASHPRCH
jgi:hypothetical protein